MKVVLLAGGFGSRISEESQFKPKPMIEIGGMPILWHIMKEYAYYGHTEFIICAGYKQEYIQEDNEDKQIVIYGKNGHAEVLGLVGQTTGKAIVIEKLEEAKSLDFSKSIRLYSQTTKSLDEFQKIVEYIKEHISSDVTFEYYDTICRQVANRIPNIRKFAASHDLVFFVSGKKSSNGKILFNECKKVNPNSHLIDSAEEIDNRLLIGTESIGICGATSTPKWLMEEISKAIKSRI